jgi:parvulin-like peptidyl-prolyl isomerase
MNFKNRNNFLSLSAVLIALMTLYVSCRNGGPKINNNTLAVIGSRVIEKGDFIKRYKNFRMRTGEGVPDTYESRRQVLNNYIDEELLIIEAEKRGFADDREGRHERKRIEIQELLNAFNKDFIASKVQVSDDELKRLFIRLNTRIKARHLYAPTKEQADSLYASLINGASFQQLAEMIFKDPKLRHSGGLLGYFTVDEMEPSFEEAAYDLEIGEISKPVRTSDGYSIIQVDDRVTKPLLTEYEYTKHKDKLYSYWRTRKIKKAVQAYVDSLSNTLDISFNEAIVKRLYAEFKERNQNKNINEPSPTLMNLDRLNKEELVRSKIGKWDVATFQEKAQFTSAKQQDWIRSERHFKEFISGLVIRDFIIAEARKAKLNKQAEYKEKVQEKWEAYLLKRTEDTLYTEMEIPEDSLLNYFNENAQLFASSPEINLREIVLDDQAKSKVVAKLLKQGASFADLAQKYSVRRWSAERGGELGFLTPQDLGKWSQTAFALEVGEQTGPVQMDSMYVFLECIGKKPSRVRSFEEARAEVEAAVRYIAWEDIRRSKIKEIRNSVKDVQVYAEKLKTILLK